MQTIPRKSCWAGGAKGLADSPGRQLLMSQIPSVLGLSLSRIELFHFEAQVVNKQVP